MRNLRKGTFPAIRRALLAAAGLLAAIPASADDAIPSGYITLETVGRVVVHMKTAKSLGATKTEFLGKFKELVKTISDVTNGSVESLGTVGPDTKFAKRDVPMIDVVFFENEAESEDFFMKSGAPDQKRPGRPPDVVYVALVDGALPKATWAALARQLTRVFEWHGLYFGPPAWLDRGLAEHFAWSNKGIARPGDVEDFLAMVERLHVIQSKGAETPLAETLLKSGDAWTQEDNDNSWVLAHLLLTECRPLYDDLWAMLYAQQSCASDRLDGVVKDSRRFVKFQIERAFGGVEGLQAAWDWHRDAIIKGGPVPKLRKSPGPVHDATPFMVIAFTAAVKSSGDRSVPAPTDVLTTGSFSYTAPWPGPITVTGALGDSADHYEQAEQITGARSDKQGTPAKWKDAKIPIGGAAGRMKVVVTWEVDGGGIYQTWAWREISVPGK